MLPCNLALARFHSEGIVKQVSSSLCTTLANSSFSSFCCKIKDIFGAKRSGEEWGGVGRTR